jgi:hypothetical protein
MDKAESDASSHSPECEEIADGTWECAPDCLWQFTGLDFARGKIVVSIRPRGGRIVVLVSADGDASSPNAAEVAECPTVREGLLLQQAILLLLGRRPDDDGA